MYPIVVVLLVEQNHSLNSTYRSFATITGVGGGVSSQTGPVSVALGPGLPANGQVDLAMEPHNTGIHVHVSFNSI
jgi:hypothetical protein